MIKCNTVNTATLDSTMLETYKVVELKPQIPTEIHQTAGVPMIYHFDTKIVGMTVGSYQLIILQGIITSKTFFEKNGIAYRVEYYFTFEDTTKQIDLELSQIKTKKIKKQANKEVKYYGYLENNKVVISSFFKD